MQRIAKEGEAGRAAQAVSDRAVTLQGIIQATGMEVTEGEVRDLSLGRFSVDSVGSARAVGFATTAVKETGRLQT